MSLTAVLPTSELTHIHFENKKVCQVFNPQLNTLIAFQKNYLTDAVLLAEAKALVMVDCNKKVKSVKAEGRDLFAGACLLGSNRVCAIKRSGEISIFENTSLKLLSSFKIPFNLQQMKIAASNCGKTIAV